MDSWDKLPTYVLKSTPIFDTEGSIDTAPYTATKCPKLEDAPAARIPDTMLPTDDRILARLMRAIECGIPSLPSGYPFPNLQYGFDQLEHELATLATKEIMVVVQFSQMYGLAKTLALQIYQAFDNKSISIELGTPASAASQVGDMNLNVVIKDQTSVSTISIECTTPHLLFQHGGTGENGLQSCAQLYAQGKATNADAMAIKLALQMRLAKPAASRFGLIYAGSIFMITELVPNPYGAGTILITSPLFSAVRLAFQNPVNSSGLPNALPSAPIIACMVVLLCQNLNEFKIDEISSKVPCPTLRRAAQPSSSTSASNMDKADVVALGPKLGNLFLKVSTSEPPLLVGYDHPGLSDEPRLVVPVSFVASPATDALLSPPLTPPSPGKPGRHLPPPLKRFLESIAEDTLPPDFTLCESSSHSPKTIMLREPIGTGRTGTVWHIASDGLLDPRKRVAKIVSCRHIASVMRETLFQATIFPRSEVAPLVPKYYGTYASVDGGWYMIVMDDAGIPVEGEEIDSFPADNTGLVEAVRQLENAFANAGIEHGDVRPSNVLRAQDGSLRLVDFGYSYLKSGGPSGGNAV